MSKFICPVCDINSSCNDVEIIIAQNIKDAEEKLADRICNRYDWDNPYNYREFIEFADEYDILIGEIKDIETI